MAETTRNESFYHKERERKVLELYNIEGKKTRYIQKELKMSPNTINAILKRDREGKEREKEKERQRQEKKDSVYYNDYGNNGDGDGNDNGNGDIENGNGNGDARARPSLQRQRQQSEQQRQTIPSLSLLQPPTALEELSDKQKAAIAYKLYDQ